jgi:hypothetical protein
LGHPWSLEIVSCGFLRCQYVFATGSIGGVPDRGSGTLYAAICNCKGLGPGADHGSRTLQLKFGPGAGVLLWVSIGMSHDGLEQLQDRIKNRGAGL